LFVVRQGGCAERGCHPGLLRGSCRFYRDGGLRGARPRALATHLPEAAGYSLVQLIETSAVTGHFCDASGDAYLDVFSCKDFDAQVAIGVIERHLRPESIRKVELVRDTSLAPGQEGAAA
jgi:S-adenosylmethionine/arginine decarboxylase-like enzyme